MTALPNMNRRLALGRGSMAITPSNRRSVWINGGKWGVLWVRFTGYLLVSKTSSTPKASRPKTEPPSTRVESRPRMLGSSHACGLRVRSSWAKRSRLRPRSCTRAKPATRITPITPPEGHPLALQLQSRRAWCPLPSARKRAALSFGPHRSAGSLGSNPPLASSRAQASCRNRHTSTQSASLPAPSKIARC